jgi:hypothetical protein
MPQIVKSKVLNACTFQSAEKRPSDVSGGETVDTDKDEGADFPMAIRARKRRVAIGISLPL